MSTPAYYYQRSRDVFSPFARILAEFDLFASITGATAAGSAATISKTAHGFETGQRVLFSSGTGFTGLTAGTVYYAIKKTADTFELADTPTATSGINITVAGSDGVFRRVYVFHCEPLTDDSQEPQVEQVKMRGENGIPGIVDEEITEYSNVGWSFPLMDPLTVYEIFGGASNGNASGYFTIWGRDTKDEAGKVRIKTERFYGSIKRTGGMDIGGGKYTRPSLKLTPKKADGSQVSVTVNATA